MLKATNAEFATVHAATAAIFNGQLQARTESGEELERCDASRVRHLLRCRLAWYGLRSVEVGSFRLLTDTHCWSICLRPAVLFFAASRSIDSRASSKHQRAIR